MKVPIFNSATVQRLWHLAENKPENYKDRVFEVDGVLIKDDDIRSLIEVDFDPLMFDQLAQPNSSKGVGLTDAHNALILFQELRGMTPKAARDERVWSALSHLHAKDYIWKRHIRGVAEEDVQSKILTNFFCRKNGKTRGFERDNALAQLWWWAFMASRVKSLSHAEALEALLEYTDFRDAIVGHPTTTIIPNVFEALLVLYCHEKAKDPEVKFFRRVSDTREGGNYRELLKLINRHGGRVYYDVMQVDELVSMFSDLRAQLN